MKCTKWYTRMGICNIAAKYIVGILSAEFNLIFAIRNLIKIPASFYLLKVNNGNTKILFEICSKLRIKALEQCHWRRSDVFIVNFEQSSYIALVFPLLTLNNWISAEMQYLLIATAIYVIFSRIFCSVNSVKKEWFDRFMGSWFAVYCAKWTFWRVLLKYKHYSTGGGIHRRCSIKMVFLSISQISQDNACVGVSF